LWESHDGFAAPPECQKSGHYTFRRMITAMWLDDAEVAQYLHDKYGIQTFVMNITPTVSATPPILEWTWTTPGYADGKIQAVNLPLPSQELDEDFRIYWYNETVLGYMEWHRESRNDIEGTPISATLPPPFLYGEVMPDSNLTTPYAGLELDHDVSATLKMFKDWECKQPL
jgi:hypothetical protein